MPTLKLINMMAKAIIVAVKSLLLRIRRSRYKKARVALPTRVRLHRFICIPPNPILLLSMLLVAGTMCAAQTSIPSNGTRPKPSRVPTPPLKAQPQSDASVSATGVANPPRDLGGINLALLVCPSWQPPVKSLQNVPDCHALEESFTNLGWATVVLVGPDANTKNITDTISQTRIRNLVYYHSGHGVTYNGKNILVTTGVGPRNIADGLALDTLIDLVRAKVVTASIYLDACRTEFVPPATARGFGLELEPGFVISDSREINYHSDRANVNIFYGSSDRKPTYDAIDGSGGVFSSALKTALDSAQTRDLYISRIAEMVIHQLSTWVGPNSERQTPVLVLGTETEVGQRLPKRTPPSLPAVEVFEGIESPATYEGFNNKGRLILVRPRRGMPEVHVYDGLQQQSEPEKTATPIGYFKAPATADKDSATYQGEFMFDGNPPVPARLVFDGTRIEISFETRGAATTFVTIPEPSCQPEPAGVNRRVGKAKPAGVAPQQCSESAHAPAQEPKRETTTLKFFDRKTLMNSQRP